MKKKVMVVDDEPDTRELMQIILESKGFDVSVFGDAHKALESLKKGKLPDILLLDMRMPGLSGPDFCEEVRKDPKMKKLKIAFFTASTEEDKSILKKYNVLGFIFKPFDNEDLVKQINGYISK